VSGNYIGTNAAGSAALANTSCGVMIGAGAKNNVIGGESSGERNVISGNGTVGVCIMDSGTDANIVRGNYIGTDAAGTGDLHNGESGVSVSDGAKGNDIGPHNVIAHNPTAGVEVEWFSSTGNTITENSIHDNGGLGIVLTDGGNGGIPSPVVLAGNACFVAGTAAAGDTIEVFTGPDEEGKTYLASGSTGSSGYWALTGPFSFDTYVTATATDENGNTSEFSAQASPGTCSRIFVPLIMKDF
jgi:parallel beta-helix repeat protein